MQAQSAIIQVLPPDAAEEQAIVSTLLRPGLHSDAAMVDDLTAATLAVYRTAKAELPAATAAHAVPLSIGSLVQIACRMQNLGREGAQIDSKVWLLSSINLATNFWTKIKLQAASWLGQQQPSNRHLKLLLF